MSFIIIFGKKAQADTLLHILVTGQSNAIGQNATPILTTSPSGVRAKMFNGGLYAGSSGGNLASLVDLFEAVSGGAAGETMCSSLVQHLISFMGGAPNPILISLTGADGLQYDGLKKGTTYYNQHIAQVNAAKSLALSMSLNYRVLAVCAVHGESDQEFGKTNYNSSLLQWQTDYDTDIKAINGQTDDIPLIACQQDGSAPANANALNYTAASALLLDKAHVDNPEKVILSTPRYCFDHPDNIHLCAWSHRQLGAYHAKAIAASLTPSQWQGVRPSTITLISNTVVIDFNVPSPPLVFDMQNVMYKPNFGFEYIDDSASATLTSVAITGAAQVTLTLSAVPTGANKTIMYACAEGETQKFGKGSGNLRDSDSTASVYAGINLYNWCIQFRRII